MIWVFSSILPSVELLLTQETRYSKSCSHWKFCFKPKIPLQFPVKMEIIGSTDVHLNIHMPKSEFNRASVLSLLRFRTVFLKLVL